MKRNIRDQKKVQFILGKHGLKKYADRTKPVLLCSELRDGELSVSVTNTVLASLPRVESTKIGLRTCEKILDAMGGRFTITRDDEQFSAAFILPTVNQG